LKTIDINIVQATYNGATYLEKMLESLFSQSLKANILARNDGSADGTQTLLAKYKNRITILQDHAGNQGVIYNFNRIIEHSDAPYVAFADQDNLWIAEKLKLQIQMMRELENPIQLQNSSHGPFRLVIM
jgi:rhamnosyltransferase